MRLLVALRVRFFVAVTLTGGLAATCAWNCSGRSLVTPPGARDGWAGPDAVAAASELVAAMPPFALRDADGRAVVQDNRAANVRLWHFEKSANKGQFLANIPQEVGDCVSWGAANAVDLAQCVQIVRDGRDEELHRAFPPYIYGVSRVLVGKGRLRGDGSVGAWAAEAVREHGVLRGDLPGCPAYSGRLAREWGKDGPPSQFVREAEKFCVRTVSPIRTADEARDAICNGYPVTIASDFGSKTMKPQDGRIVARRDDHWSHQMCLDGYDGSGSRVYFHVRNSWGPNAHPQPIDDSPPGGFWITEDDCRYIVRQGDSFAFSEFDGFPAQPLDLRVLGARRPVSAQGNR